MRGLRTVLACWLAFAVATAGTAAAQGTPEADKLNAEVTRLYKAGKYAEAIPIAQKVLAIRETALGREHPDVAMALDNLAGLYQSQGRYTDAEPLYKRSLATYERALGPDHPEVATALNNFAQLYQRQGRFAEAEPLMKRSLFIREKTLRPDHPYLAQSLNNLAMLYRAQGRLADAESLMKRSLAVYEKGFGPDHPEVATALNNLAGLLQSRGRYAEAEPLFKRSLAVREKALGPAHPDVATALSILADLYGTQGRFAEAEPLFKRSLAIREKALGPGHPAVAGVLDSLAGMYRTQGRYAEAEPLMNRGLAIREKTLGSDHPDVANSVSNLAVLYWELGRYADAEPLHKRSLAIREKALGPEHPSVALALDNLAALYQIEGLYAEAEPLFKRSLAILEKALGPEHLDVAKALNNLALLYERQGRFADAEPLTKRSLAIREKALGTDHPEVATALNNLALLYLSQGHYGEIEPLMKRSLAIREKTLGSDHPGVAMALDNLAGLYRAQGRFAEAEPLMTRSLAISEKTLGSDHPQVAATLNNFAWLALGQNDLGAASNYWQRATALLQRRAVRGTADRGGAGASKGSSQEAQRNSWYFDGLVKTTHRLAAAGPDEIAKRARAMFETAQWGQSSEAAATLAQMAARAASGKPELAALARERQDLVGEWQAKDKQLTAARSEPPGRRNAPAETVLADRLAAIDARLAAVDGRLAKDFPDYAALASPRPASVADVQAILRADEALLLFLDTNTNFKPLPEETFIWVVTKTEMRWLRSELGSDALVREVAALRCGLDTAAWSRDKGKRCAELLGMKPDKVPQEDDTLPFDAARAYRLYKSLLGEAEDILQGKQLLIVPSGALTTLPFQVLVAAPPKSSDLSDAQWLIRDHAISVLPSVASLVSLRRTGHASTAPKPMIGFANPLLDGDQKHPADAAWYKDQAAAARAETGCANAVKQRTAALRAPRRATTAAQQASGHADLAELRRQAPLPETADEVCEVARGIGADVSEMRIGAHATEAEVKRLSASGELASYRIVHFATHGVLAGELSGTREPGLILTPPAAASADDDGYLSSSEVAGLKLDADWVILSACNTAGGAGQGRAAEALSGLARTFFYAGARGLLVSHWEVDSDAAVKLVTGAVGALAKGKNLGRAQAMRSAMLAVMADDTRPKNWVRAWHPSVWAPFVVVGEGGAGR